MAVSPRFLPTQEYVGGGQERHPRLGGHSGGGGARQCIRGVLSSVKGVEQALQRGKILSIRRCVYSV